MNPRTKLPIAFLLLAGTSGYPMASSIRDTGMYYVTPSEVAAKVAAGAIIEGRSDATGAFHASVPQATRASRFEAAPDKHRDRPGYQAATKRAS